MFKRLWLLFSLTILCGFSAFSQTTLTGKVTDNDNGEAIIQCGLIISKNGIQVTTIATDFDGNYSVQLDPGKYEVEARYIGYQTKKIEGINVLGGKANTLNIKIAVSSKLLDEIQIVQYRAPLIEKDNTTQGQVITAEKIKNLPVRSVLGVASTAAGLSSVNGSDPSIRGSRSDATVYYLDGIRYTGRAIPTTELEQLQVVTGGIESQYGDVTGGIIALTSKGPSAKFSGGVEAESSQLTDSYGYNLLSANFSGPLLRKKLTDSTYGRTVLGYRLAGQYNYQKDDSPPAYPVVRAKESTIQRLTENPLKYFGETPYVAGQFLDPSDVETVKYRPNNQNKAYDLTGKLDFRPLDDIDLSLAANYSNVNDRFNPGDDNTIGQGSWGLLNWINNPVSDEDIYRVNIRFRHRLGKLVDLNSKQDDNEAHKTVSNIQNAFYTIQGGYQKDKKVTQDWQHKDRFFEYGYLGKFYGTYIPTLRFFPEVAKLRQGGWNLHINNFKPTYLDANGVEHYYSNEAYANWNKLAYKEDGTNPLDSISHLPVNLSGFRSFNGNADKEIATFDNTWGSIYNNVGGVYNRYEKLNNDLITLQVTSGFDFLPGGSKSGRHNIQFGLVYEQRINRSWVISPYTLWRLARLYTNNHISGIDYSTVIGVDTIIGGVHLDTLFRTAIKSPDSLLASGSRFYRQVRERFMKGIPIDSALYQWYNVDSLTSKDLTLDMFSARELADQGVINFSGYDYLGNTLSTKAKFDDFFTDRNPDGTRKFTVAPFSPIYVGGYIQDKFTFKDIIFRLGLRVDYYDANTKVLKDPYSLYGILGAKAFHDANPDTKKPASIGDDYKVYVTGEGSNTVKAYRNGDQWYNSQGTPVNSSSEIFTSNLVFPKYLQENADLRDIQKDSFKIDQSFEDYKPEINWMPRLAFSFPISDNSNFFAHYDILVQRPASNASVSPLEYYYFNNTGRTPANNANLKPSRTVDYEVGFQQKVSNSSAIKLSAYYKELRNMINRITYSRVAIIGTYDSYGNIDFGTVKGFNFSYDLRRTSNLEFTAAYTLQFADGTGSDAESQKGLTQKGLNIRNIFPFNYDERHRFSFTADYRYESGKKYNGPTLAGQDLLANTGLNVQIVTASGRPYSPGTQIIRYDGSGYRGDINGSRLPWNFNVDIRLDKNISIVKGRNPLDLNVYLRIQNLFDTKNVIGVYRGSGDPLDDGYLKSDKGAAEISNVISSYGQSNLDYFINQYNYRVINSGNFTLPRRIYIGAILEF